MISGIGSTRCIDCRQLLTSGEGLFQVWSHSRMLNAQLRQLLVGQEEMLVDRMRILGVPKAHEEVCEVCPSRFGGIRGHVLSRFLWDGNLCWPFWVARHLDGCLQYCERTFGRQIYTTTAAQQVLVKILEIRVKRD